MAETVTDIVIDASVDEVWRVLSDFSSYPEWNPYIRHLSGTLETDARLTVTCLMPERGEQTSHPKILMYRPCREIRWQERPILPGLLDAEHGLKLEPLGPEQVRFVHWRSTSGLLSPIAGGGSNGQLRGQLEAMNLALKGRVEDGIGHPMETERHADVADAMPAAQGEPAMSHHA